MKASITNLLRNSTFKASLILSVTSVLLFFFGSAQADKDIGTVASTVTATFGSVTKLITATAYVTGLGFSIGAMLKFKQHKDNPTQIPIGTPVAMLFIAAALIFIPNIFSVTGHTLFGDALTVAGPSGTIYMGT